MREKWRVVKESRLCEGEKQNGKWHGMLVPFWYRRWTRHRILFPIKGLSSWIRPRELVKRLSNAFDGWLEPMAEPMAGGSKR